MKSFKPLALLAMVLAMTALYSCAENFDDQDPYINVVGETTLTIPKDKATLTVQIQSNREWGVRMVGTTTDWIVAEPARGNASSKPSDITVTVAENTGANRTAAIEFFTGAATAMLTIVQEGPDGDSDGIATVTVQDFISRADKETYYRMTGTVSGFNSTYCSFDLTDETGTIYVYSVSESSKATWASVIKNGGTVTLQGQYEFYSAKSQHEVVNAIIESFTPGETQTEITDISVADFINKASTTIIYRLTGTVSGFKTGTNSSGRNWMQFNLTDGSGTILVYGFQDGQYEAWSSKIKDNGTVVLEGVYQLYNGSQHEVMETVVKSFSEGAAPDPVTVTVTQSLTLADNTPIIINESTVVAISTIGLIVTDGSAYAYIYFDTKNGATVPDVAVGDKVKVEATKSTYNGVPEMVQATVTKLSSGTFSYPEPKELTSIATTYTSNVTEYVSLSGTLTIDKEKGYYNLAIPGVSTDTKQGSISSPLPALGADAFEGKQITVTGFFTGLASNGKFINILASNIALADPNAKYCTVSTATLKAKADDTSASFSIATNAGWEVSVDNPDFSVSPASGSGDATISISFQANEGDSPKVANIRVFCADAGVETMVVLTQVQPGGGENPFTNNVTWTLIENAYDNTSSGSSQQSAVINGETVSNLLKLGTSSKNGKATITIPAGTTKLAFYCLGWANKTSKVTMTCGSSTQTYTVKANSGVAQNPPYTITTTAEESYYEFAVPGGSATAIEVESDGRVILWGVNAY